MSSSLAALTSGGGGIAMTADSSGNLNLLSGTTTVLALTATGVAVTGTLTSSGVLSATSPTFVTPVIDSATVATVSGTAPLYMCRAWVNFNGTGTVAINASGNVSSITDNGTGNYTVNFTTAMSDANYSVAMMGTLDVTNSTYQYFCGIRASNQTPTTKTASALQLVTVQSSTSLVDSQNQSVAIFR